MTPVMDKEEVLPPLRNIIHSERQSKAGQTSRNFDSVRVSDEMPLIFGSEFVSALQNKAYKRKLINYLCSAFVTRRVKRKAVFHH